jgi:phage terminase small subunit
MGDIRKISAAIEERQHKLATKLELSAERVLTELARIGFSDVRGLFDGNGNLCPIHELPDDVAAFVASVQVTTHIRRSANGTTVTLKVRLWDKVRALELLMRHLGLLKERLQRGRHETEFYAL